MYNNSLSTATMGTAGMNVNIHILGNRHYELTNHLGNVQATVIDRTQPKFGGVENSQVIGYNAEIPTAQDYYPFGMLMPGRYTSDTQKHCVTINSTVLVSKPVNIRATRSPAAIPYRYVGSPAPPAVHQLPKASAFEDERLYVFHYNPVSEHQSGWVTQTTAPDEYSVTYRIDLGAEPSGILAYMHLHMDTNQSEQQFGFEAELHNAVWMDVRVRQYYNTGSKYYLLRDWTRLDGNGAQQFTVGVNKAAVAAGGKTLIEYRIISRNGASFPPDTRVSVLTPWTTKTTLVPENRVVTICEEGEDYRFGVNGMEKDNEPKGKGNSLDFGARIYDSRLGRWLSLDPDRIKYPYQSPYVFADNTPIQGVDREGKGLGYAALLF